MPNTITSEPDPSSRSTIPLSIGIVGFCAACSAALWLGFTQKRGMIVAWTSGWISYPERLWPIGAVAALSLGLALCLALAPAWQSLDSANSRVKAAILPTLRPALWLLVFIGFALSLSAVWVLRGFPNSGDEYDYLFQARTFLAGRLWNPLLPGHEFFSFSHIIEKDRLCVSQYPPGWPLLLALAHLLGLPFWAACPLLGLGLLAAIAELGGRENGPAGALVALLLIVLSPFFVFNAGSFFSHVPAALFGLLFCYFGVEFIDAPRIRSAILAGAMLGMLGLIKTFDVIIFVLPFGIELLIKGRRPHYRCVAAMVLGGLPFLAILLFYNWAITGNPLLSVMSWGSPLLHLGWPPRDELGVSSTFLWSIRLSGIRLIELAEWSSPLFILAYLPAIFWKIRRRKLRFYDLVFFTALAAFLFYPSLGGNRYGPRYYFEAYPLMAITVASAIVGLTSESRGPRIGPAIIGLTAAHIMTCLIGFIVIAIPMRKIVDERMDIYDRAHQAALGNAIIILHTGTGVLRAMNPGDLVRDGIDGTQDVLYALDLPRRREELKFLFPTRRIYVYDRPDGKAEGTISPLE